MQLLITRRIQCPYCGQSIDLLIDCSIAQQQYIEDCQVCCRPMELTISVDDEGDAEVLAYRENE